jgi:hypothetical protein
VLGHKLIYVVVKVVVYAVDVAYRSYALTHGNLFAPRSESRITKRELGFRALLSEHETELLLTIV